ncbi:hypothetical protein DFH09DRAFT_1356996 [Mycena vulgaris]|nr:hypothetical protein DFH09DRAFT_1356996 [Mycena vulgaris]
MPASIVLSAPTPAKSNDASISKYILPPPYIPGPYTFNTPPATLSYLPSLAWFCLTKLALFPNQVNQIGPVRLTYHPPASDASYDILRALIPSLSLSEFDWANVDPRLWATIVQIYDNLPAVFQCYPIPLADEHLQLLQSVKSTPQFSLVTILELPGCRELKDSNIFNLKYLHGLCALDASDTHLSSYAVKVLSETVSWGDDQTRRGPWGLRILRLRNCRNIDSTICANLPPFQLLSILDVRGTQCRSDAFLPNFHPAPPEQQSLYHPTPLRLSMALLSSAGGLFSSPNVFTLHVNTLYHPATAERPATEAARVEDVCVTLSAGSSHFFVGSSKEVPKPLRRLGRFAQERKPSMDDPGGSSLGGSHRRRFTNYALHNHIADQELSAHAAKQDVLSFYRSEQLPARARNSSRGYTYPPEAPMPPSAKDAELMLYRPPPPWAALEATTPDVPLAKHSAAPPGVVTELSKRKCAEMAEYAGQQLSEKRRRIQATGGGAAPCAPETVPLSRNPFRRKVSQQEPLPEMSRSAAKPMKTISSFTAPPLPVSTHLLPATTRGVSNSESSQPALPRLVSQESSVSTSSLRDSGPERPAPPKGKRTSGAFDWGGWGKK